MKSFELKGRAHCLAACVTAVLAIGGQSASAQVLATDKVFAANSFWYTPIPLNVPLHPNNGNFVTEFLRQKTTFYNNVNINTWSYASPVYTVGSNWPIVRVTQWDCQNKKWLDPKLAAQWAAVPMPPYVVASSGTDAEMTIYQPSTDTIWEFWRAGKDANGKWLACWGGSMPSASKSGGGWGPSYGVTAAGLPFIGGQITAEELTRGEIRHAIGIALVEVERPSVFSWPASRSDGYNPTNVPNRIPEGQRFRLDPSVNVDSLPMTTAGKIIARAAQKYGFVVWDKAGSISIRANNPLTYTAHGLPNPYPALFSAKPSYAVLDGFPWNRLQFLPFNYGKP